MIRDYSHKDSLKLALSSLQNEDIFVYPTDTIYGFGGDAGSAAVIEKLYEIKERPLHMPVSMLVRDHAMLHEYAHVSEMTKKIIDHFLPGALTLVLPAKDINLPEKLFSGEGFLGFRIPDHEFCKALSTQFNGPIITTSVNVSGRPALNSISDIQDQFGDKIDLIISDPELEKNEHTKGSTVLMITKNDEIKILREGSIPQKDIYHLLEN